MRLFVIGIVLLLLSCKETTVETVYVIEAPHQEVDSIAAPAPFVSSISWVTDVAMCVSWDVETDLLYDIAINDSVVSYDNVSGSCNIENLRPNTAYVVSILAYNKQREMTRVDIEGRTMKSYIAGVLELDLGFQSFFIDKVNIASDQSLLILGSDRTDGVVPYVSKLNAKYEIQFLNTFDEGNYCVDFIAAQDEASYALVKSNLYQLDAGGDVVWSFDNPDRTEHARFYAITLDEHYNVFVVGSSIERNYVYKLSPQGELLMSFPIERATMHTPSDIFISKEGNIFLAGNVLITKKDHRGLEVDVQPFTMMVFDASGNVEKRSVYSNKYNGSDFSACFIPKGDNGYWVTSTTTGYRPPHHYWGGEARILGLDLAGDSISDFYHFRDDYWTSVTAYYRDNLLQETALLVINDYDKNALYVINDAGQLVSKTTLPNLPKCRFLHYDKHKRYGDFFLVSIYGHIIFINEDGYRKSQ